VPRRSARLGACDVPQALGGLGENGSDRVRRGVPERRARAAIAELGAGRNRSRRGGWRAREDERPCAEERGEEQRDESMSAHDSNASPFRALGPQADDRARGCAMSRVCVFAPGVLVTVTIEDHPPGEEVHFHAGGQGAWVARMAHRLGARSVLCTPLGGEAGDVARALLDREGIEVRAVQQEADTSAYVHDRRSGERDSLVEPGAAPLGRHTLDELYSITLGVAIETGVCVLTGAGAESVLPARTYERLAHDLRATGSAVIADLHGESAAAALDGGLDLLKISTEELEADGLVRSLAGEAELVEAARTLQARGARTVIVSRAEAGTLAVIDDQAYRAVSPQLTAVDTRGAGDSMTAALAVGLGDSMPIESMLRFASAAGSLNVTRHGLATGYRPTIDRLSEKVDVSPVE